MKKLIILVILVIVTEKIMPMDEDDYQRMRERGQQQEGKRGSNKDKKPKQDKKRFGKLAKKYPTLNQTTLMQIYLKKQVKCLLNHLFLGNSFLIKLKLILYICLVVTRKRPTCLVIAFSSLARVLY